MTTNMIRADIDLRAFYRWAGSRGMISRNAFDPGFAMHCLLTESFGRDLAPKPFRVIIPRDRGRVSGTLYAYSTSGAEELRDAAQAFACPLQSKALPTESIDSKTMPGSWRDGTAAGLRGAHPSGSAPPKGPFTRPAGQTAPFQSGPLKRSRSGKEITSRQGVRCVPLGSALTS